MKEKLEKPAKVASREPYRNIRTQVLDSLRQRFVSAGNKVPAGREAFLHSRPHQPHIRTLLQKWMGDLRKPTADPEQAREVLPELQRLLGRLEKEMAQPARPPAKIQRAKYLPTKRRGRRAKSTA